MKRTIQEIALGAVIGGVLMGSFLWVGFDMHLPEREDVPVVVAAEAVAFPELERIPRAEIVDMAGTEDEEAVQGILLEDEVGVEAVAADYTQSDLDLLAALVWSEAGDQDFIGMRIVADCVCNRASDRHPEWPSSISAVIYQPGQFEVVANGRLDQGFYNATPECYEAARLALSGDHYDTNVIYFSMYYCANGQFAYQHGDHFIGY